MTDSSEHARQTKVQAKGRPLVVSERIDARVMKVFEDSDDDQEGDSSDGDDPIDGTDPTEGDDPIDGSDPFGGESPVGREPPEWADIDHPGYEPDPERDVDYDFRVVDVEEHGEPRYGTVVVGSQQWSTAPSDYKEAVREAVDEHFDDVMALDSEFEYRRLFDESPP